MSSRLQEVQVAACSCSNTMHVGTALGLAISPFSKRCSSCRVNEPHAARGTVYQYSTDTHAVVQAIAK